MPWYDGLIPQGIAQAQQERALGRFLMGHGDIKEVSLSAGIASLLTNPAAASFQAGRNYENVARLGYTRNVYIFRATKLLAEASAGIPWKLYSGSGDKRTTIDEHPILTLLNKRPNPKEGAGEFLIALVSYWLLAGDTYAVALRASARGKARGAPPVKGTAAEIYALRPDLMEPVISKETGDLTGYIYRRTDGTKVNYDVEDVLHAKQFSPLDDYSGVAPAMVAGRAVDQHNAANDWNTALLQNQGKFPAVVTTEKSLTPEQRSTLQEQFKAKYTGAKNAGKAIFGDGGIFSVQKLSDSPSEMDWLAGKMAAMREIAVAYGIAPELLGDGAAKTFSNMKEARASMYTEAVLPLLDILRSPLMNWLFPMFSLEIGSYDLDVDKDNIEALQEDREKVWERAHAADSPLTINERRELLGKEPVDDGDVILVSNALVPLEQAVKEPEPVPAALGGPGDAGANAGGLDPQGTPGEGEKPGGVNPAQDRAQPPTPTPAGKQPAQKRVVYRRPFVAGEK